MPVELSDEQDDPVEHAPLVRLAELVLADEGIDRSALLSIALVRDDQMAELNAAHLGKTGPTDVLSFPIEDLVPGAYPAEQSGGPPLLVGDVVIAPAVVRNQAAEAAVAFEDEMALMVVHGILHLLGYDHEVSEEAEVMEERERLLLARVGVARR